MNKVIVDTNIWINFLKGSGDTSTLQKLIIEDRVIIPIPVKLELINGARIHEMKTIAKLLEPVDEAMILPADWQKAEILIFETKKNGFRFHIIDILIAIITNRLQSTLYTLDKDFTRMEKMKLVKLFPITLA